MPGILPMASPLGARRRDAGSSCPPRRSPRPRLAHGIEPVPRGHGRGGGGDRACTARAAAAGRSRCRGPRGRRPGRSRAGRSRPPSTASPGRSVGPRGGPRPARGAAGARDRARRWARAAAHRAARLRQDAARPDDPGAAPAARRRGGARGDGRRVRRPRRRCPSSSAGRPSARRTTRRRTPAWSAAGRACRPGEVTLADHGVLFCDELPEFGRDVLEALRQPLEEGSVSVVRVGRAETFPARFPFVAAMNPCPCGQLGAADRSCSCPPGVPERYLRRVSGPLRDRIDLWVVVDRVPPAALIADAPRSRRPSSRPGSRPPGVRQHRRNGGTPNAHVRGRPSGPPARCRLRRRRGRSSSPSSRACPAAARSGCSASPGRSRTSTAQPPSSRRTSTRRPGSGRRSTGWPWRGPADARRGRGGPCGRDEARPVGGPAGGPAAAAIEAAERDAWVVLDEADGVGPVSFGRLLGAFGSARAVLRASAEPGGARALVAATADGDGGSPSLTPAVARAPSRPSPRTRSRCWPGPSRRRPRAHPRRRRLPVAAPASSSCRRRCCSSAAASRRWTVPGRSPSSGRGGRPRSVGGRPHGSPMRSRAWARRSCRGSRSASTPRRTRAAIGAGGPTVAVIGGGHERLYPAGHRGLAEQIVAGGGAVISEFAPRHGPEPRHLPAPQPDHQRAGGRDGRGRGRRPERRADDRRLGARAGAGPVHRSRPPRRPGGRRAASPSCARPARRRGSWPGSRSSSTISGCSRRPSPTAASADVGHGEPAGAGRRAGRPAGGRAIDRGPSSRRPSGVDELARPRGWAARPCSGR